MTLCHEATRPEAAPCMDEWWAMVEALQQELPDFSLGNITATCDASFRCGAYSPREQPGEPSRWVVVGCMSILAPVYTIYGVRFEHRDRKRVRGTVVLDPLPPDMRTPSQAIAKQIESRFGASALPPEFAATPIPLFVEPRESLDTTLFHALFTAEPASVP